MAKRQDKDSGLLEGDIIGNVSDKVSNALQDRSTVGGVISTAGSILPGPFGAAADVVGAEVSVGGAADTTQGMAEEIAARLGMTVAQLETESGLVSKVLRHYRSGGAHDEALFEAGKDVAIGIGATAVAGPLVGGAATLAERMLNPSTKAKDLSEPYAFVMKGSVTPEDVVEAITEIAEPQDKKMLALHTANNHAIDPYLEKYVPKLLDNDFDKEKETIAQYLARKFNPSRNKEGDLIPAEYEKAALLLDIPVAQRPIQINSAQIDSEDYDMPLPNYDRSVASNDPAYNGALPSAPQATPRGKGNPKTI